MDYPKVCLRRGEEAGVLKGQKLIYDNELDWADVSAPTAASSTCWTAASTSWPAGSLTPGRS